MVEPIIEIKGSLKELKIENMLVQQIRDEIHSSFPSDIQSVKMNVDLINQICNAIESISGRKKINKLELFMKIYKTSFGQMDAKDEEFLTNIIEHLHDKGKIRAQSLLSKIYRFLKSFLVKK
jgi:ubiquitin C-terminal hydrolase